VGLTSATTASSSRRSGPSATRGNTVVVVEHDEETIRPRTGGGLGRRGRNGGRLMYQGPPGNLDGSLTGLYLRGDLRIEVPAERRPPRAKLRVLGAARAQPARHRRRHPLGVFTAVTGVSGAGKSDARRRHPPARPGPRLTGGPEPGRIRALEGAEAIDKVIRSTRARSGARPRSNPPPTRAPSPYPRDVQPRARGRAAVTSRGRFSFNVKGGRCEPARATACAPSACTSCRRLRSRCEGVPRAALQPETLEILLPGADGADVLDMTVAEASPSSPPTRG